MLEQLGWVQFRTHRVIVSKDDVSDRIYCFKHTGRRCEFASFDREDEAADYIIMPLPSVEYYVNFGEEDPENPLE